MSTGRKTIIRNAVENDLPEIKEMIKYLMEVEKSQNVPENVLRVMNEKIKPAFRRNRNRIFIAERSGEVCGFGLVEFLERKVSSLSYIVVKPEFQKYGIGGKLAKIMIEYARSKKAEIMEAVVARTNVKSKNFHKKLGFEFSSFLFKKEL